jgi:TolB-like protein/cytochrome c-type biogenesis protein CcmH/NrfG
VNPRNFFAELKRRNVYKVAVAYAIVGWLLVQVATQVFPFLEIPNWVVRLVIVLVAIGFPIALVIAWAFELTPEGLKRTEDADSFDSRSGQVLPAQARNKSHAWIYIVVVGAFLSVGLFMLGRYTSSRGVASPARASLEKSIAVLPFENLSEEKANAYFADGIQEEILTRLAKIADLKVISRTSTQQYQSKPGNLSEIAKQLGVAHILEGSVQKAGDQVRVNVQLIDAQTDAHLWADTYDRKLTDIFGVESEIAKSIAESLRAKLTGVEEQALAIKPTANPEAYDAYLRGLAAEGQQLHSVYALEEAVRFYEQAVQLDPAFALAWSRLSRADFDLYSSPNDPTASRRDAAKRALDVAQKLQPNSPETLLALATYQVVVLHDYELAKTTYRLVGKMLPGSIDVPVSLARIARRQGHWDEAVAYYEQALVLDPRSMELLVTAASNYSDLRKFDAALKLCDRALDILPNDPDLMAFKASIYQGKGNLEEAAKLLRDVNAENPSLVVFAAKVAQLRLERNLSEALRLLKARVAQYHFGAELEKGAFTVFLAFTQHVAGDSAGAKITAEQARNTLEPICKNQPDNDFAAACLSQAYVVLGDKNSALKEGERAIALKPSAEYGGNSPGLNENLALIRAIIGENSGAISTLAPLLEVPYWSGGSSLYGTPITHALLRLDPTWDSLRADPAFQKLCQEKKE